MVWPRLTAEMAPLETLATLGRVLVQVMGPLTPGTATPLGSSSRAASCTRSPTLRARRFRSIATLIGATVTVQTTGATPSRWAVNVVVPRFRAVRVRLSVAKLATVVSATVKVTGTLSSASPAASSARISKRRVVVTGMEMGSLPACGTVMAPATGGRTASFIRPTMP